MFLYDFSVHQPSKFVWEYSQVPNHLEIQDLYWSHYYETTHP